MKCAIINCDNHSTDGTREAFFAAPGQSPKLYVSTSPGQGGKGRNLRNFFEKARKLDPKALVVIEADVRNISPVWIRNLAAPVLKGRAMFARFTCAISMRPLSPVPLYILFCGASTGGGCGRPMWGIAVQPEAADLYLATPLWNEAIENFGIDIWMSNVALAVRLPVVQAFMGAPKVHRLKDPYTHLTVLFHEVLSTIFDLMLVYKDFWQQVKWSKPTALSGTDLHEVETPLPVDINTDRLHERFLEGFDKYCDLWGKAYGPTVVLKLQEMRSMGLQHFSFPTQTWLTILFDSAVTYRRMDPEQRKTLLDALLPLYLGKSSFIVKKTERMSLQQAEEYIENECMIFEENKPYIIKVWT